MIRVALASIVLAAAASAQPAPWDDLFAWRTWSQIAPAIAPAPLDGPEEVVEKAEIIADRRDDLAGERTKIEARCAPALARMRGAQEQLEAARELSELRGGRDVMLRQRLHELRERRRTLRPFAKACEESLSGLAAAVAALAEQHAAYLVRAEALRDEETR